jgi:hypothetical protein
MIFTGKGPVALVGGLAELRRRPYRAAGAALRASPAASRSFAGATTVR